MKIWTITTDDGDGTATAVYTTAEAADSFASSWVRASWKNWFGASAACHDDWREALSHLVEQTGYNDSLTMTEHDIAHHPAIAAAIEALDDAEAIILRAKKEEIDLTPGEKIDIYDAIADSTSLLRGTVGPDDPFFGVSPDLQAAMERHEAAYRDAAKKHATDDLEFDDEPAVIFGDDDGAFVSCWLWVSETELPADLHRKPEEFLQ